MRAVDKVVKGVFSLLQFAVLVPVVTQVVAAANVCNGKDDAAIQQR